MPRAAGQNLARIRAAMKTALGLPQGLAFLPALTLAAFWLGGEHALLVTALIFPLLVTVLSHHSSASTAPEIERDPLTGLANRETVVASLGRSFRNKEPAKRKTAAIVLSLQGIDDLGDRFGSAAVELALERVSERLSTILRDEDVLARIQSRYFAIALSAARRTDLEAVLQITGRLQEAVREPISLETATAYLSSSAGFCLQDRAPAPDGEEMLKAAEVAMREAVHCGPGAIRAFSAEMQEATALRRDLAEEITHALNAGQIVPWFQPQISTDTGEVTGFEALARWVHPARGVISPGTFLAAIEQAGLSEQLSEQMLFHSLSGLRAWDNAGIRVPSVGVNFSGAELRNPKLIDKIKWELDRFDLTPDRLTVEVLETVVSHSRDDIISHNIAGLAKLGCGVDLDDFGTGHASISSIRGFTIRRLKIDRSFVTDLDQDREQQDMIAAILTIAERLHLETLAEGVETVGEHAMLSQLGCGHVQGYGIARPMPFEDTIAWMRQHAAKLEKAAELGRKAG
ncbi:EAL domain-containing protein [Actibacterium atlanticum]|uniref:EAL domain-containing protein n=1 Tax=Actibacterium atlanticum TaxID=1461693 RepID=A0A058ZME7_9RHOB|nr:phosphodiesterase [Actibacterium atlanticum]KCV82769.1 EAL domain-containing protein [Actibacterium atlanticum]